MIGNSKEFVYNFELFCTFWAFVPMWIKGEKFQLVLRKTIQRNSYDLFAKETHICWPFSIAVVQVAQVFKWHSLLTYTQFSAWLSAQWAKRNRKSQFWKDNALFASKARINIFLRKKLGENWVESLR